MPTRQTPIPVFIIFIITCSLFSGCFKPVPESPVGLEPAEVVSAFLKLNKSGNKERARQFCSPDSNENYVNNYDKSIVFLELIAEFETGDDKLHIEPDDFITEINGDVAYVIMKEPPGSRFDCRLVDGVWLFYAGPDE